MMTAKSSVFNNQNMLVQDIARKKKWTSESHLVLLFNSHEKGQNPRCLFFYIKK